MVSCFVPLVLAATLGQSAPAEAAWLKAIPADVAVVAHVKALETGRDDLIKMVEAMSPTAAGMLQLQVEQGLQMFTAQYGKPAAQNPFFTVFRLPAEGAPPAWAVLVQAGDYQAVLKAVAGKDDLTPKSLGGYDSFEKADGLTWYGAKGAGFVAFGPDESLIKAVAKPTAGLDEKLSTEHKARLLGGDLGVYVNVAALQAQYAEQIEQGKQLFLGAIDQAGAQMPGNMAVPIKALYAGMFDAVKFGDALSLSLTFAADGLTVSAFTTVKPDSAAAQRLAQAAPGSGELLARLPTEAASVTYLKLSPESMTGVQKFGLAFLNGGKSSPEMEKGLALQRESGAAETYAANNIDGNPSATISLSVPKDPAKAVEATTTISRAMKSGDGAVKDVTVTPKAQSYKGFTFNEAKMTFNLDNLVAPGTPGGAEAMKKMLGGDTITSWCGTDGKMVLTVSAKSFDEAKALIDAALSGKGSVGESASFAALRKVLPREANVLFAVNAQGMVKQFATQISAMTGKPAEVPADLPRDPAFFGGSLTATPKGYGLQFSLPSNVGPVVEKGVVPIIRGMHGQAQ